MPVRAATMRGGHLMAEPQIGVGIPGCTHTTWRANQRNSVPRSLHSVSLTHASGMYLVSFWYASGMLLVCLWYASGMLLVCLRYASGMHLVCIWYVSSMYLVRLCMRLHVSASAPRMVFS
jgi:hypothetical protein